MLLPWGRQRYHIGLAYMERKRTLQSSNIVDGYNAADIQNCSYVTTAYPRRKRKLREWVDQRVEPGLYLWLPRLRQPDKDEQRPGPIVDARLTRPTINTRWQERAMTGMEFID